MMTQKLKKHKKDPIIDESWMFMSTAANVKTLILIPGKTISFKLVNEGE
jgi:hypothetical protein